MGEQTTTEDMCGQLEASLEAVRLAVRGSQHYPFALVFSAFGLAACNYLSLASSA